MNIDIMLVPGNNWHEINPYHSYIAFASALEQGFNRSGLYRDIFGLDMYHIPDDHKCCFFKLFIFNYEKGIDHCF